MIDSPLIRELLAESTKQTQQEDILLVLEARLGAIPEMVIERLKSVHKKKELTNLLKFAVKCPNLQAFQDRLLVERPRPASSRKMPQRRKPRTDQ